MGWSGEGKKPWGRTVTSWPWPGKGKYLAVFAQKNNLCPGWERALLGGRGQTLLLGEEAAALQADRRWFLWGGPSWHVCTARPER